MRTSKSARQAGYRSGSEERIAKQLEKTGLGYAYEPKEGKIAYTIPAREAKYLPDFVLSNGIIIEVKGFFSPTDRKKHLLIRQSNPDMDIRFVFDNAGKLLGNKSKTTYAAWCTKNAFKWAEKKIPASWIEEGADDLPW